MKRRYQYSALAFAGIALLSVVVVLNPGFQRWVVLGQLEKIDPEASLERLAMSPFSTEVRGLKLAAEEWQLELPTLELEYSPWSLLVKHVKISRLHVEGVEAALGFAASEKESAAVRERLPGVFEGTELGWRISLDGLAVDARMKTPDAELALNLSGGGLAPEATGVFQLKTLRMRRTAEVEAVNEAVNEAALSGTLRVSESSRGAMTALGWDLNAEVKGALFEVPPRLGIKGAWTADDAWADTSLEDAETADYPPERFFIEISENGAAEAEALLLGVEGVYDSAREGIEARFSFKADKATLAPFAWGTELPQFDGQGDGELDWDLATMSGSSSMKLQADLSQLKQISGALSDVGDLWIDASHKLSFKDDHVRLERFSLDVKNHEGEAVIALETPHALTFTGAMLEADNLDEYGFERPWLSLNTEIPLEWLDPLLGGLRLSGADLQGRFDFSGSPLENLVIAAKTPFEAQGANLSDEATVLVEAVALSLSPSLEVQPDKATMALDSINLGARGHDLVQGALGADIVFGSGEAPMRASVKAELEAFIGGLLRQDLGDILPGAVTAAQSRLVATSKALGPSSLKMSLAASASGNSITAESLSAELVRSEGDSLLEARLLHPVRVDFGAEWIEFKGLDGTWLEAVSRDLPIDALAPWIDAYRLEGDTLRGGFTLAAGEAAGGFVLESTEAWSLNGLSLGTADGELWMKAVDLTMRPGLDYSRGRARLEGADFRASRGGETMAEGDFSADAALDQFEPESIAFSLAGRAKLVPLFEQPALAPLLRQPWELATSADIEIRGRTDLVGVDFSKLSLEWLQEDGQALFTFALTQDLAIERLAVEDFDAGLQALEGEGITSLDGMPLRLPLAWIDPTSLGVDAGRMSGIFEWQISQGQANLKATEPLRLEGVSLSMDERSVLESLSFRVKPWLHISAKEAVAGFENIKFQTGEEAPLTGEAEATLTREKRLVLKTFDFSLNGGVAPWFAQGFMPENEVAGGRVNLTAGLDEAGRGSMRLQLEDFGFRDEEAALSLARLEVNAERKGPNESWPGNASLELETSGGRSDLAAKFKWLNRDEGPLATIAINGEQLQAGDLQRFIREFGGARETVPPPVEEPDASALAVSDKTPEKQAYDSRARLSTRRLGGETRRMRDSTQVEADDNKPEWEEPPEEIDFETLADAAEAPEVLATDSNPFWEGLPADLELTFDLNEAIYTDYLKFSDLSGEIVSNPRKIGLERFAAYFYESAITASGGLNWDAAATKPYGLAMDFDVSDFDLKAFFTELAPEEQARVEGLFRMAVNAEGTFPSLDVAPNHIRFVFELESLKGLFRAIPPGSPLDRNASKVAATAGAILSWAPTGGLALGALSRLVSAMREIPYDRIALRIVRETDLNVHIEEMIVRSSEILIQGRGGILYEDGVDLFRQRMGLTAEMDARGDMAGILAGLALLSGDRLENDYWRGFRFRIWGSLEEPKSNFGQIVTGAGANALTHNLANPFLGIWSNIKFRGTEAE